ncbi:hypothetical protein EU522_01010 [Candidatus Thorarchaeota archaeon]|nr:MAG: hypothetical protein EU522_01010 [Candidatus Thorarchaeota archaeon]
MGLFGTSASILVDINLILQYITLVLLIIGWVKKKPYKQHGYLMMVVLVITLVTTIAIMAPSLLVTYETYGVTIVVHAVFGITAMILGTLFAYRFIAAMRKGEPLLCGTKNLMRFAFLLWLIPILGGTVAYISMYV